MGNGYFSNAEYLYSYIEAGDTVRASDLVKVRQSLTKNNPELLNSVLTHDSKATALGRSVWRGNFELCKLLLGMGSLPNTLSNQLTPLMIACLRNHAHIVDILLEYKADVNVKNKDDLTAFDYTILYGNYALARKLATRFQLQPQYTVEQYQSIATKKKIYYVNYDKMLNALDKELEWAVLPQLFDRPPKPKLKDPVIDPNESWKNFVSRVSRFQDPPLVERDSLPWASQPQNRILGKFHYAIEKLKGDTVLSLLPKDQAGQQTMASNRRQLKDNQV